MRVAKCTKLGDCDTMQNHLNGKSGGKGLCALVTCDSISGQQSVKGVIYRCYAADRGTLLNFCPWCGKQLELNYHV